MTKQNLAAAESKVTDPKEVLAWAAKEFGDKAALAMSFGAEDMVILDMIAAQKLPIRVFTLDTGKLHQETYDLMERALERYKIRIEVYFPQAGAVEKMTTEHGPNLFYRSLEFRKMCCNIRKVEPLERALKSMKAWITGLRREQSVTRLDVQAVEKDPAHGGISKINPLIDWSEKQVWDYIKANKVPYNSLHDRGFPSIGCGPCTRAIKPGEDVRAGRWWWEDPSKKECGLHPCAPK